MTPNVIDAKRGPPSRSVKIGHRYGASFAHPR
jgi:hypothetical protein